MSDIQCLRKKIPCFQKNQFSDQETVDTGVFTVNLHTCHMLALIAIIFCNIYGVVNMVIMLKAHISIQCHLRMEMGD